MQKFRTSLLLVISLLFSIAAHAQATQTKQLTAKTETIQFESKLIGKKLPYIAVLPPDYEKETKTRYAVLYLLHGLTGHYDNWTSRTKITEYAMKYRLIIITPEGNDGWYSDSVTQPTEKYESYFIQELMPDVQKRYRTIEAREGRAIAGLSMGGYGALKFGIKYPDMFVFAGSLSGALPAARWTSAELDGSPVGRFVKSSLEQVFGDGNSDTRKSNDIYKLVRELPTEQIAKLPFIYLDCGTEDGLVIFNAEMANLLVEKKIPHEYRQLPGTHNWIYWDKQVQEVLRLTERFVSQPKSK
jgi:S-formylglutathione hydrolase FrmB